MRAIKPDGTPLADGVWWIMNNCMKLKQMQDGIGS